MANLFGKNLFKTLLIIIMLIQPVAFSYAMTSMDHNHHAMTVVDRHDGHHAMHESMVDADEQHAQEDGSVLDNCCYTAACSPAAMMSSLMPSTSAHPHYVTSCDASMKSIDLPSEIKPPRPLLGYTA